MVNHGIWKRAPIDEMTPEQWDETLRVNLGGAYAVCHHAARHMIPRRSGAIVTIASTSGQRGEAYYSHYAASKGAIIALTKSLAAELAPHGIRVNGVAPGWVLTDMTRGRARRARGRRGRWPRSPSVAPALPRRSRGPWPSSPRTWPSYLFGEILCVNGGAVMAD